MVSAKHLDSAADLEREVAHWLRSEEENLALKNRVSSALDEIKGFLGECRADLEKRRGRLLQTGGFKDETRAREAALANIQQLFSGGRNISRIFAEIDKYLATYNVDDPLSRLHTRVQLADARDEFIAAFHESIRGTRLSDLLDVLYFMPYSYWRSRGLERRNYRSPTAAEILALLEELGRRGIDFNRIDTVQLAASIRIQLGITPRMNYHAMVANKLAELLTDGETLTRFTAKVMPLDVLFCHTAAGILSNLRRWSTEFFGSAGLQVPAEIEAELLQIVFLAGDTIRVGGTEHERSTDYLLLLSTVIASDYATLKDVLAWPSVKNTKYPAVHERIRGAKTYLDNIAVLADGILAARWSAAKGELTSLSARTESLASKATHEFGEFQQIEHLKEQRLVAGKSLIKTAESLHLIEAALLDMLAAPEDPAGLPPVKEHLRTLDPARLIDRNRSYAEETNQIARQELEKLRVLIGRIATISRKGFGAATAAGSLERPGAADKPPRRTTDGVEIGGIPAAAVQEKLLASLRKAVVSVREAKGKVEWARKRTVKSDMLPALNTLYDKTRKAVDACERIDPDAADFALAPAAVETIAPLLREIMTAHTTFSARVSSVKLTPAEKQLLTTLLYALKTKPSDDLKDIETLRLELAERSAEPAPSEAAVKKMAGLATAANKALKPVKDLMVALGTRIAAQVRDNQEILAATQALKSEITEARELMAGNLALVEAIAAASGTVSKEYADKIDRWQRQLAAVETETGLMVKVAESLAEIDGAVRTAAALEQAVTARCQRLPGEGAADEGRLSARSGCVQALETIGRSLWQARETREACAAAAGAKWRLLKAAPGYLASSGSSLVACEAALNGSRSRIEMLHQALLPEAADEPAGNEEAGRRR